MSLRTSQDIKSTLAPQACCITYHHCYYLADWTTLPHSIVQHWRRGAPRQQRSRTVTESLSCVGGTLLLLLFLSAKPTEVNTKQLWCSEVTFWSMCSSPWTSAKATIVDFMPRLGRTLAPSHCFLWPGSMDSQPGKKAPFLKYWQTSCSLSHHGL